MAQQIMIEFISEEIADREIEVDDDFSVEENVVKNIRRLNPHDFICLVMQENKLIRICKLAGFDDAATISNNSILYSFNQMEKYFYEHKNVCSKLCE